MVEKQVWEVRIRDRDGFVVAYKEFRDGKSYENHRDALELFNRLWNMSYCGYLAAPEITMHFERMD